MSAGIVIDRQWVSVLHNGSPIVEWGDGFGVDLYSGEFIRYQPGDISHAIQDSELEILKSSGRILHYTPREVSVPSLPELPHEDIE